MTRKFHIMSIEDREMFAYNAEYNRRQEALKKHYAYPENSIRYAYEFLGVDPETDQKCYLGIYSNLAKIEDVESHF